jgi:hypothetical protein
MLWRRETSLSRARNRNPKAKEQRKIEEMGGFGNVRLVRYSMASVREQRALLCE